MSNLSLIKWSITTQQYHEDFSLISLQLCEDIWESSERRRMLTIILLYDCVFCIDVFILIDSK